MPSDIRLILFTCLANKMKPVRKTVNTFLGTSVLEHSMGKYLNIIPLLRILIFPITTRNKSNRN